MILARKRPESDGRERRGVVEQQTGFVSRVARRASTDVATWGGLQAQACVREKRTLLGRRRPPALTSGVGNGREDAVRCGD